MHIADLPFVESLFLIYFVLLHAHYLALNTLALASLLRYLPRRSLLDLPIASLGYEPPVSILMPAHNEEGIVLESVQSLLDVDYPEFEVIVINDGSSDRTLALLKEHLELQEYPETHPPRFSTRPIHGHYLSRKDRRLRVIDKENGGKGDALNAGLNASRSPFICTIDADSILAKNSLRLMMEGFLEDSKTVAAGGSVRVANGCRMVQRRWLGPGMPRSFLALVQIVEYWRAFLFGRLGWSAVNGMTIISGAFGIFRREVVMEVGGFRTDTLGEDMELVVRIHRKFRREGRPYRIRFLPEPICWTEVPENFRTLGRQRERWQRGLSESLAMNRGLLFHPRSGVVGWISMPCIVLFEWLEPLIQVLGLGVTGFDFYRGRLSAEAFTAFLIVMIGLGLMQSLNALLLEQISFHVFTRPKHLLLFFLAALAENFVYRQCQLYWRLKGLTRWLFGRSRRWGDMEHRPFTL